MIRSLTRKLFGKQLTSHNGDTQYPLPSALAVWLLPLVALVLNVGFILQKRLSPMNTLVFVLLFFAMLGTYLSAL